VQGSAFQQTDLHFQIATADAPLGTERYAVDQFFFQLFWTTFYDEIFLFDLGCYVILL
jgi:hypothetical protein